MKRRASPRLPFDETNPPSPEQRPGRHDTSKLNALKIREQLLAAMDRAGGAPPGCSCMRNGRVRRDWQRLSGKCCRRRGRSHSGSADRPPLAGGPRSRRNHAAAGSTSGDRPASRRTDSGPLAFRLADAGCASLRVSRQRRAEKSYRGTFECRRDDAASAYRHGNRHEVGPQGWHAGNHGGGRRRHRPVPVRCGAGMVVADVAPARSAPSPDCRALPGNCALDLVDQDRGDGCPRNEFHAPQSGTDHRRVGDHGGHDRLGDHFADARHRGNRRLGTRLRGKAPDRHGRVSGAQLYGRPPAGVLAHSLGQRQFRQRIRRGDCDPDRDVRAGSDHAGHRRQHCARGLRRRGAGRRITDFDTTHRGPAARPHNCLHDAGLLRSVGSLGRPHRFQRSPLGAADGRARGGCEPWQVRRRVCRRRGQRFVFPRNRSRWVAR